MTPPMYFATPSSAAIKQLMREGRLGYIATPRSGNKYVEGSTWCADNSCFSTNYPGDEKWLDWLGRHTEHADKCVFATAPDVVGDAEATLKRSRPLLPKIRELGFPAAYVAQDGSDIHPPPWDEFDVLFVGGTTEFKLGPVAQQLIREAKTRGMWVHCGRVNSYKRMRAMEALNVDSVDGTYLKFHPTGNLADLLHWTHKIRTEPGMFQIGELA